jgi:hypothetical protein
MHVAKMQPHRPRLGDLRHFVEIAPRGRKISNGAEVARTGEEARRQIYREVRGF